MHWLGRSLLCHPVRRSLAVSIGTLVLRRACVSPCTFYMGLTELRPWGRGGSRQPLEALDTCNNRRKYRYTVQLLVSVLSVGK